MGTIRLWVACAMACVGVVACGDDDGSSTLGEPCASDRDCNAGEACDGASMVCVLASEDDGGAAGDGGTVADGGGGSDGGGGDVDGAMADLGTATCGDRVITPPETCDDGNTSAGDGCDDACQREPSSSCGDGTVDRPQEDCDDGNTATGDGCDDMCRVEVGSSCGDSVTDLAAGEECDDGNTINGDGCDDRCQVETFGAFCGDSTLDSGELCDDGNTTNGDGCNPTCNLEGRVTTWVGAVGMAGSTDGVGGAARIGNGVLAVDDKFVWFAENGNCGSGTRGRLRQIDIATAAVTTLTTFDACAAEGIATDGSGMVWVAGVDVRTGNSAIFEVDTNAATPAWRVVAGNSPCGSAACYSDDSGGGTATFGGIRGLTWWGGLLYIVDPAAGVIRSLDPSTGTVLDVAGDPFNNGVVDGTGAAARFQSPRYIVSDGSANLYVSETNSGTIRQVNAFTGVVTTFAGNGTAGYVDDVGAAARSHRPRGITSDGTSVYWVEFNAHAIRQGIVSSASVSTLAGNVTLCPPGCPGGTSCRNGVCLPPSSGPPAGGGSTDGVGTAAEFFAPFSIAYHYGSSSLFVIGGNHTIRRIQ